MSFENTKKALSAISHSAFGSRFGSSLAATSRRISSTSTGTNLKSSAIYEQTIAVSPDKSLVSTRSAESSKSFGSLSTLLLGSGMKISNDIEKKSSRDDDFLHDLNETTTAEQSATVASYVKITDEEINAGKQSMFWLCYYVRYLYDLHRLILKEGYDPMDASTMAFMRHLYPFSFGKANSVRHLKHHYYKSHKKNERVNPTYKEVHGPSCGGGVSKSFLNVIGDYQIENFMLDCCEHQQSRIDMKYKQIVVLKKHSHELNFLLGVWEVLLYMWTPAFIDLAMKGDFTKNLTSGR